MSNVYTSIDQLIGHPPLLELTHFERDDDLHPVSYTHLSSK